MRKHITGETKYVEFRQCIDVSRVSNKSPRVPTSSYSGGDTTSFYGFDMPRMLGCLLVELLFGNIGVSIPTYVRNDNPTAAYQVDAVNTVTNAKRINGFLESHRAN